ncbi:uncharacterized protein LOC105435254 [Cucumis sativus]|uniref:Uncharacterized protein n=1 Tax=Cucumis sativus TaxID=3659 RepID=A0A0A0L1H9_CUCSA|nr:uncharacterized protein LOC105435254 [Cucumis sativus]
MVCETSEYPQKSLQFKQNDKFISKILSRESSRANYSSRIYYGGLAGAVPFVWESQPGTPIHRFSDDLTPPLTPPPSYFSDSLKKPLKKRSKSLSLLHIFFSSKRKFDLLSPPPVSKSPSLSSSGSVFDSAAGAKFTGRRSARRFPTEKEEENAAATSSVLCFGIGR